MPFINNKHFGYGSRSKASRILCWDKFPLEDMSLLQKTQEEALGQQNNRNDST